MLNQELSPLNRDFLPAVAHWIAAHGTRDWLGDVLQLDQEAVLCESLTISQVQEATLFRSRRRAILLATWIIDDEGNILRDRLMECVHAFATKGHIFHAHGGSDRLIHAHIAKILSYFVANPALSKQMNRFSRPLCHPYAERLVRASLFLSSTQPLQNAHIRRAVLAACLTLLRQSVGSCFATAPALRIQTEQIEYFLQDLYEILATGRLKRVVEGVEYAVPLSPSFGMGDLRRDLDALVDKYPVFLSPGLLAACEAAGLFPEARSLQKQEAQLRMWLEQHPKERRRGSIIDFFEGVILQIYGISREEWEAFYNRRISPQRLAVLGAPSPRDKVCEKVEIALRAFKETFVAFVDHPLLKSWEFTLASFSESKAEFSKWNLYASLGLDPNEEGGIGRLVAKSIEAKLENANEKVAELQEAYEIAFDQVRGTEALLRQADSEEKARRLQVEYQSRVYHMHSVLDLRDETHRKGKEYASMLSFLVKQYDAHFPQFFQEIYDAEMFDAKAGPYQDSMAGFRLVYKHGRNDPSQWTMIHDAHQYIESLIDFFKMTETAIASAYPYPSVANEIIYLTDRIIAHMRSSIFIETAMLRIKMAHTAEKLPGHSLDMLMGEKKPWAYISGGTMETLLKIYYRYPGSISAESRWVESTEDLLVFLLDALKGLPLKSAEFFEKNRAASLLMHSPNHAFVLYPGWSGFFAGWQDNVFTYTWVRDNILHPGREFFSSILLSPDEQMFLVEEWIKRFSEIVQHQLLRAFAADGATRSVHDFVRTLLVLTKEYLQEAELIAQLDAYFYEMLPLCSGDKWKEKVFLMVPENWRDEIGKILERQPDDLYRFLGSRRLQELAKAYLLLARGSLQADIDLHQVCAEGARAKKLAPPCPLLFADTNWPHFVFGFMWGAASERLRLWRFDATGTKGVIMKEWESFLQGEQRLSWGVYTKLEQYQ